MDERMSAAEVLAQHLWRGGILGCECGWNWPEERTWFCGEDERIAKAHVAHQLDALREAGWELVRPAEPTHSGPVSTSFGWVTSWDKTHQVRGEKRLITLDEIGRCISPEEARILAAQLLAAAVS